MLAANEASPAAARIADRPASVHAFGSSASKDGPLRLAILMMFALIVSIGKF